MECKDTSFSRYDKVKNGSTGSLRRMFRLKQLVFPPFNVKICTFIWFVCNFTLPLHPQIQNY